MDDERRLFYVACSRARQWLFLLTFAPQRLPDYVPKRLLENYSWDEAPYVRKIPDGLYRIEITNAQGERSALYENTPRLRELQFEYDSQAGIPIRWRKLESSLADASQYLVELIIEFRPASLQWILFDACGASCFQWPGPIRPEDFRDSCLQAVAAPPSPLPAKEANTASECESIVNPLCRSIYEYFLEAGEGVELVQPKVRFELRQSGDVIAKAELAWPDQKAGIVLTEEAYEKYTDADWRVWFAGSDGDERSDHMELVDLPTVLAHLHQASP